MSLPTHPFFLLEPEVAGGWGEGAIYANQAEVLAGRAFIPRLERLHYQFDGWLGGDILAFISTYIVTERLGNALRGSSLTGFRFDAVSVSTSDVWEQCHPNKKLPRFERLVPEGHVFLHGWGVSTWSGDDFCLGIQENWAKPKDTAAVLQAPPPYGLVVSQRTLRLLRQFELSDAKLHELNVLDQKSQLRNTK